MRTGVYLLIINLNFYGRQGERQLVLDLVKTDPLHRIIVHETEQWENLASKGILYDYFRS